MSKHGFYTHCVEVSAYQKQAEQLRLADELANAVDLYVNHGVKRELSVVENVLAAYQAARGIK